MARRRMIDPNFWTSEDVGKLNMLERLLLIGMFSSADDYGKGRANPVYLRSIIFPYDDIPVKEIETALSNIEKYINIKLYEVDGSKYYKFMHWDKWQTVQKPQPSKIPEPIQEAVENNSGTIQESVENDSRLKEKEIEKENKEKENINICSSGDERECEITPAEKSSDSLEDDGAQSKKTGKGEYTKEFEDFWAYYPRKVEKRAAFRAWKARLKDNIYHGDMIQAAINYAKYCQLQHTEQRFIKHASTFLGPDKPFEEYIHGIPEAIQNKASPQEPKGWNTLRTLYDKYKQEEEVNMP